VKRRLFNVLTGMSLVLCVAWAVLWVRSYFVFDVVTYLWYSPGRWHDQSYSGYWSKGSTGTAWGENTRWDLTQGFTHERLSPVDLHAGWPPSLVRFNACGVMVIRNAESPRYWDIMIPCWMPTLLASIAPAMFVRRLRKLKGAPAEGECRKCGYDMRATRDRCPECGTVAKVSN